MNKNQILKSNLLIFILLLMFSCTTPDYCEYDYECVEPPYSEEDRAILGQFKKELTIDTEVSSSSSRIKLQSSRIFLNRWITITWSSNNSEIIDIGCSKSEYYIYIKTFTKHACVNHSEVEDKEVMLTAHLSLGNESQTKTFKVVVKKYSSIHETSKLTHAEILERFKETLKIGDLKRLPYFENYYLNTPKSQKFLNQSINIEWNTDRTDIVKSSPTYFSSLFTENIYFEPSSNQETVILTATIKLNEISDTKQFKIVVPAKLSDQEILNSFVKVLTLPDKISNYSFLKLPNAYNIVNDSNKIGCYFEITSEYCASIKFPFNDQYCDIEKCILIKWESIDSNIIKIEKNVAYITPSSQEERVTLVATVEFKEISDTKEFEIIIPAKSATSIKSNILEQFKDQFEIPKVSKSSLHLYLPEFQEFLGKNIHISWHSRHPLFEIFRNSVGPRTHLTEDTTIILIALITLDNETIKKEFEVTFLKETDLQTYEIDKNTLKALKNELQIPNIETIFDILHLPNKKLFNDEWITIRWVIDDTIFVNNTIFTNNVYIYPYITPYSTSGKTVKLTAKMYLNDASIFKSFTITIPEIEGVAK